MAIGKEPAAKQDGLKLAQPDAAREPGAVRLDREPDCSHEEVIGRLQDELEEARRQLQISREEFEAASRNLRAANEELRFVNEEYRSAAGALETGKQELQSINAELQTVNAELKIELEGASRANVDMQNLMAAAGVGTLFLDGQLHIRRFTPTISRLFSVEALEEGRSIADFAHRLHYPDFAADVEAVLRDRKIIEREVAGNGNGYLARLQPYRTIADGIEGVVCTFVDVTSRLKAEEALKASEARLRLILSELSHRMKNTLAVVQSMARQSFRGDVSREDGLEIFSNRLRALAEAHNLLVSSDWRGACFRELAGRQLGPYAKAGSKAVILEGPVVSIPPDIATPLALVLHELATNAMKYGALSPAAGTLRLEWGFEAGATGPEFRFTWRETGGPTVKPPAREGFGSWLIRNGLPEARVVLDFPESGAVCTVSLPAGSLKDEGGLLGDQPLPR